MTAAAATPLPLKNTAFRFYFDLRTAAGVLVTGWTTPTATVSLDGGNYASSSGTPTEIQTSGTGYLDLTAGEMNTNNTIIKVSVANTGALVPTFYIYPATGSQVQVNIVQALSNAVTTTANGVLDVNVKNINNVATTSVTAVGANVGTAQPLNFTGTAGSALVKTDVTDIATAAVSTSTAQLGVNAVNIAGVVPGSATIGTVTTATTATNLTNAASAGDFTATMKTSLNAATPASIQGNVGGDILGNVLGNVANVLAGAQAFFAQFFTQDSGKVYADAVDGSVVKVIATNAGSGGGSVDVKSFSSAAATQINQIEANTNVIGSGVVTVVSAVSANGNIVVAQGSDNYHSDGLAASFLLDGWPDITGGAVLLEVEQLGLSLSGTITASDAFYFDIARTDDDVPLSTYQQVIRITLANGHVLKPIYGTFGVTP